MVVTTEDIIIYDEERSSPRCSLSFIEIVSIKNSAYNNHRSFTIMINVFS